LKDSEKASAAFLRESSFASPYLISKSGSSRKTLSFISSFEFLMLDAVVDYLELDDFWRWNLVINMAGL